MSNTKKMISKPCEDENCNCHNKEIMFIESEEILTSINDDNIPETHKHKCEECGKGFSWRNNLIRHKRIHRSISSLVCSHCQKQFRLPSTLRKHVLAVHLEDIERPIYVCGYCEKEFLTKYLLKKHLRIRFNVDPEQCPEDVMSYCQDCGKQFSCRDTLRKHELVHSSIKPFICPHCQKQFRHAGTLNRHVMVIHMFEKKEPTLYICGYCGIEFPRKGQLEVHIRSHFRVSPEECSTGSGQYKCQVCGVDLSSKAEVNQHRLIHPDIEPFVCTYCQKHFRIASLLKTHVLDVHLREVESPPLYICGYCGIEFHKKGQLEVHMRSHFRVEPVECSTISCQYKCQVCAVELSSWAEVNQHRLIHPLIKPFVCTYCQKHFQIANLLKKHVTNVHLKVVENPALYICGYCGIEFQRKGRLAVHMRSHFRVEPVKCSTRSHQYKCQVCEVELSSRAEVNQHRLIHPLIEPFFCTYCQKHFQMASLLKKHVASVHPEETALYICGYCGVEFQRKDRLAVHMRSHFRVEPVKCSTRSHQYKCQVCAVELFSRAEVNQHRLIHPLIEPFVCTYCQKHFQMASLLKKHMVSVHPEETALYICGYCGVEFLRKGRLAVHMSSHFAVKPADFLTGSRQYTLKCQVCQLELASKAAVNQHRLIHPTIKPFVCTYCQKHFRMGSILNKHVVCVHPKETDTPALYICGYCEKEYHVRWHLKNHMKIHIKVKPVPKSLNIDERIKIIEEKKRKARRYLCEECGTDYSSKAILVRHNLKRHTLIDSGMKPSICSLCQEQFSHPDDLKTHMASVHPEEIAVPNLSLFICGYCEKEFETKNRLKMHMKIHSEIKPCPKCICEICGKEFTSVSKLHKHSLTHSGVKPFACSHCVKRFSQAGNLKKHTAAVHPKDIEDPDVFVCGYCQKEFHVKERLKMHMRTHSGVRPYKCTMCPMTFCRPSQYKFHQNSHSKDKRHSCPHCPAKYISPYKLRDHIKKHETLKLSCKPCNKTFVSPKMYQSHITKLHTDQSRDVTCPVCNKVLKGHLKDHMLIHSGKKNHKCEVCGMSFLMRTALTVHQRKHK